VCGPKSAQTLVAQVLHWGQLPKDKEANVPRSTFMRRFGRAFGLVGGIALALVACALLPCAEAVSTVRGLQGGAQDNGENAGIRGQEHSDNEPLSDTPSVRNYLSDHPYV
jgi:hypothetical protein